MARSYSCDPGAYTLRAQAPGYRAAQLRFVVSGQRGPGCHFAVAANFAGQVRFEMPAPATLHIDAGDAVPVPAVIQIAAGKHSVLMEAAGYLPYRGDIEVQGEGKAQIYAPTLTAEFGHRGDKLGAERRSGL